MPRNNAATPANTTVDLQKLSDSQDSLLPQNVKEQANELLTMFENVDDSQLVSLTADYLEIKENTEYVFIFIGRNTMKNDKGLDVQVVELLDKNNKKFIHASTVLVSSLSKVTKMPCMVKIVTKGKVKSANGYYLDMDVLVIPQTIAK